MKYILAILLLTVSINVLADEFKQVEDHDTNLKPTCTSLEGGCT